VASSAPRLAAFSIDLDEITEYYAIHGLGSPPEAAAHLVYRVALPRLLEFAGQLRLPLTLFVIGRDLTWTPAAAALKPFVARGDELGNHTLDHAYDVSRWPSTQRRAQVERGAQAIHTACGVNPRGFRAPGYTLSDGLVADLTDLDYVYDSSVFACPAYYAAKAGVLAGQRLLRRRSKSILDQPSVLRAPTQPYRLGVPYFRRGNGLREIPIGLTRRLRLPFFGTSLGLLARGTFGEDKARWFTRGVQGLPVVNLELHGIDFLDTADGLEALHPLQPGLDIPWRQKQAAYAVAVEQLRKGGHRWLTLHELALEALP